MLLLTTFTSILFTILYELPFRIWVTKLLEFIENDKSRNRIKLQGANNTKEHMVEMRQKGLSDLNENM
jgi:hypothetical protein